jgi:hypothetical protein
MRSEQEIIEADRRLGRRWVSVRILRLDRRRKEKKVGRNRIRSKP